MGAPLTAAVRHGPVGAAGLGQSSAEAGGAPLLRHPAPAWGWQGKLIPPATRRTAALKAPLVEAGGPDALSLALIMSDCWNPDEGWTYPPKDPIAPGDLHLRGGHLPTAIDIVSLLRSGKLETT